MQNEVLIYGYSLRIHRSKRTLKFNRFKKSNLNELLINIGFQI